MLLLCINNAICRTVFNDGFLFFQSMAIYSRFKSGILLHIPFLCIAPTTYCNHSFISPVLFFQCTVTCGQGLRYRVVLCIDHRGMHTGGCSSKTKPHIKEECIVPTPCYKPKGNDRKILMNFCVSILTTLWKFQGYSNVSNLNFPELET